MNRQLWDFSPETVIKRAVEVLTEKAKLTRDEIDKRYKNDQYPVSVHAWDSYKKSISASAATGVSAMKIDSLYRICQYTGVSADYLLGLADTKMKDQSAERVREELGLSDDAMQMLKRIKGNTENTACSNKAYSETDFVNFMLCHFFYRFADYAHRHINESDFLHHLNMSLDRPEESLEETDIEDIQRIIVRYRGNEKLRKDVILGKIHAQKEALYDIRCVTKLLLDELLEAFTQRVLFENQAQAE
jgi:hypothetical protein